MQNKEYFYYYSCIFIWKRSQQLINLWWSKRTVWHTKIFSICGSEKNWIISLLYIAHFIFLLKIIFHDLNLWSPDYMTIILLITSKPLQSCDKVKEKKVQWACGRIGLVVFWQKEKGWYGFNKWMHTGL